MFTWTQTDRESSVVLTALLPPTLRHLEMLTEVFAASIGELTKAAATHLAKDAGILLHEFQPIIRHGPIFKKSATAPNCLAVSRSHIFAAQIGKAVVHVYSREKGNQEATVPFTERITCIALACDDTVLLLGTVEGRILLWEIASGRQITTDQAHLQKITSLKVDPTSNFLLSASADSTVHVWSLPALLSFSDDDSHLRSPLGTFSAHRAGITALAVGHSSSFSNIAVTASDDRTCLVWDFHTMAVLRTFLLPVQPTCLCLDPADRVAFVGYSDGGVQMLDLLTAPDGRLDNIHNGKEALAPIQPQASSRLRNPDTSNGAALCIDVSFDGCTVLTGHESGTVLAWDVARGRYQSLITQNPLPGPVTNLVFLPVLGLPDARLTSVKIASVVKPKFGAYQSDYGGVPLNYSLNVELLQDKRRRTEFEQALTAPCFSTSLLEEGLSELAAWGKTGQAAGAELSDDFMALDAEPEKSNEKLLLDQVDALKSELEALRRVQQASFDKIEKMAAEKRVLLQHRGLNGLHGGDEASSETSDDA